MYGVEGTLSMMPFHISDNLKWHNINMISCRENGFGRQGGGEKCLDARSCYMIS